MFFLVLILIGNVLKFMEKLSLPVCNIFLFKIITINKQIDMTYLGVGTLDFTIFEVMNS
jgi:hypothetical protein